LQASLAAGSANLLTLSFSNPKSEPTPPVFKRAACTSEPLCAELRRAEWENFMTSIRNLVYAALLASTALSFAPTLASAQEPRGTFTLKHEVHWANAIVPAGDYRFSFEPNGVSGTLTLTSMTSPRKGYMLMVHDSEEGSPLDRSQLVLQKTPSGRYVSALQLPDISRTLNFAVPSAKAEKAMAKTVTTASVGSN
jgi:hypothetical protein